MERHGLPPATKFDGDQPPDRKGSRIVTEDLQYLGPSHFPSCSLPACQERETPRETRTPPHPQQGWNLRDSEAYCRKLATQHYENFSVASQLVPKNLRQDIANVYAFARWGDDLSDEVESRDESLNLLQWWEELLQDMSRGQVSHPVFVALKKSMERHALTIAPFQSLLRAFRQDQATVRYENDEAILDYCQCSANPVGRILLTMAQSDGEQQFAFGDSICSGLQIANFCQDMKLDAARNRIYLPRSRWLVCGINEGDILRGEYSTNLSGGLRDWCRTAEKLLLDGLPLVKMVPLWLARALQLFIRGGLAILSAIHNSGYDVWTRPVEVRSIQKIRLLTLALLLPRSLHARSLHSV